MAHVPQRHSHRERLDATFDRALETIKKNNWDPRLQSDLSKYLCVLVSGFIEQSIRDVYREYANDATPRVQAMVSSALSDEIQSPKAGNLVRLAGRFDKGWACDLEDYLKGERKEAINSVVSIRHIIAHGQDTGVSYYKLKEWYGSAKDVVAFVELQCSM